MILENNAAEAKVRRAAKRIGWRVEKSRARNLHSNDHRLYQLIDDRNCVVGGLDYDASLQAVAYWIEEERLRLA